MSDKKKAIYVNGEKQGGPAKVVKLTPEQKRKISEAIEKMRSQ